MNPAPEHRAAVGGRARRATLVLALAALAAGGFLRPATAVAQTLPPPQADHPFGCQLGLITKTTIETAIKLLYPQFSSVAIDFIVVNSVPQDNDGQPLKTGGTTGPILCSFSGGIPVPPTPYRIATTTESTLIPGGDAASVDILSNQQQSVLQYRINGGTRNGQIEKRVCQTTDGNTDCFRLFKP